MTLSSAHLRGIVIAGALAALALALGFVTLAMNQTASSAAPHTILSLTARHHAGTKHKAKASPVDKNLAAALAAGLPRSIASALAARPVVVVELTSQRDAVAKLAAEEAQAGAKLAKAAYIAINVDHDGGDASHLTEALGQLPTAPATLVYVRPSTLVLTLLGFNDRTAVQQAAANAPGSVPQSSSTAGGGND